MSHILEVKGLHQRFLQNRFSGRNLVYALNGVDLYLDAGETLGIVGETGCGKSTLCRTIMGLGRPQAGTLVLDGKDISQARGKDAWHRRLAMQMVFQDPADSMNPRMDVGSILAEPLVIKTGKPARDHHDSIRRMLEDVGMPADILERYPHEFSGGQRQRIAIARALILKPRILVCDEPVSALDVSVQAQILNLLLDMQEEHHLSMIFVSHALGLVRHMSDRIMVMYLGTVVEEGESTEVWRNPAHPYTRRLMESYPGIEGLDEPAGRDGQAGASGQAGSPDVRQLPDNLEPPLATRIPSGCPYQASCPLAVDRCVAERPVLRELGPGHRVACHRA